MVCFKNRDSDNNNLYIEYEAAKREVERLEEKRSWGLKEKDIKDALTSLNDIEVQFTELAIHLRMLIITGKRQKRIRNKVQKR